MNRDSMLSVLHICTDFWPSTGGIERFVLDLATHSRRVGIKASVLCLNRVKSYAQRLAEKEVVSGIEIMRIPFLDLKFYKPCLLPLSILACHDVLHVHGVGAQLDFAVLTKTLHRKPLVLSTHGGLFHTNALLRIKNLYFFGLQGLMMPYVDVVAACSKTDARLFGRISNRVTLIENAVDVEAYLTLAREPVRGRCLYVGRLADNKGVPKLLRAFAVAARHGALFELHVIGRDEGGNRARYEQLVTDLNLKDRVIFVGEVDQMGLLREYQQAEIFLSASEYEGFGLAAIEAKAAGCRLVLQPNAAFTDIFSSDDAATLLDFNDENNAGSVLGMLLVNSVPPRSASREVEAYSWQRKIAEWRALYESCWERTRISASSRKAVNPNNR